MVAVPLVKGAILALITFACVPAALASSLCNYPGTAYQVTKDLQIELDRPGPDVPLVAWTTDSSFVLYARQTDFIQVAKALGEKQPEQQDIHDLYRWIEAKMPTSMILLDEFDADHSEKRRHFLMELASEGKVFVRPLSSGKYLSSAKVEWFACSFGKSIESGGKRLRTDSGVTIHWTFDWIA